MGNYRTLTQAEITAIAAEVARVLAPMLGVRQETDPPPPPPVPGSFAARRQAALDIAAKKGCLKSTR